MRQQRIRPSDVARIAGISRQHLGRLRYGTAEPTRAVMVWVTLAVRRLSSVRVRLTDLFDLEGADQ
jgi:hypothetical protein